MSQYAEQCKTIIRGLPGLLPQPLIGDKLRALLQFSRSSNQAAHIAVALAMEYLRVLGEIRNVRPEDQVLLDTLLSAAHTTLLQEGM